MQKSLVFAETSPSAPGTAASSQSVIGSSGAAGIAQLTPISLDTFQALVVFASLIGATGGTLDVHLQQSPDFGTTWVDYAHFPQLANGAAAVKYMFSVSASGQLLTPAVVGTNLSPALAANTVIGGAWGDRFRLVMIAGTGTTAGAAVNITISAQKDP